MQEQYSLIFQSAKITQTGQICDEFEWAKSLQNNNIPVRHVYGVSGGALIALAFCLSRSAIEQPETWGAFNNSLKEISDLFNRESKLNIQRLNLNPTYGFYNLEPLRQWLHSYIYSRTEKKQIKISDLPTILYLCAIDRDATFTLFGPPNESLQFQYHHARVDPPEDAPLIDAAIASMSTMLSIVPHRVNGHWYRDCRPAIVDAGAIIVDIEKCDSRIIIRQRPQTSVLNWKLNLITSSFIMHSQHERNQPLLASYYLNLKSRHHELSALVNDLPGIDLIENSWTETSKVVRHIDLPYVGSTEAFTNMRQSVENKKELIQKFQDLLSGQLDDFPFDNPANIIYGAGGFSGILAGLVTTRAVDNGFSSAGGAIQQVYGVSAGVLNGFFHAVKLAASMYPDLYKPAAFNALDDLENFISTINLKEFAKININPRNLWQGVANLQPLEAYILDRLSAYTGSNHPDKINFDDIALPLTIAAAREDGFTDFLGMSKPERVMQFAGQQIKVQSAPISKAILAGWSMNTYIQPTELNNQFYRDGGGAFYDIGLFAACLDEHLTNMINIHLDEPEGNSYHLPPRPKLLKILFDTHNYTFPEERRRMFMLTNLLYEHYQLRDRYTDWIRLNDPHNSVAQKLPPDFRHNWQVEDLHLLKEAP